MNKFSLLGQIKWCFNLTVGYRKVLFIYYLAELFVIACSLLFIIFSKKSIDYAVANDKNGLESALYWSIGAIIFSVIFKFISIKSNEICKMRMTCDIQNEVAKAQLYSEWEDFRRWNTGDLLVRVQKDSLEVVQMIVQTFPNFTLTIIRLLTSFGLLWIFDSRLALVVFFITPLFIFSKLYYRKFRKLNIELKKTEGELSHVVTENLKYRMLIQTLGIENFRVKKLLDTQNLILSLKHKILTFSLLSQTSVKIVINIGFLVTFIWSVLGLYAGTISFGMMSAFLQLVGRVQNPLIGLLGFFPAFVSFGVSLERISEVLLTKKKYAPSTSQYKIESIQKIELSNVSFKYEEIDIIKNLNLILNQGESTAIIGASGKGKTTLIRLLLSIIRPQEGEINLFFNNKIELLDSRFKTNFGYVPQGDILFSGTIRENLIVRDSFISEKKINEALRNACAEFVFDLPDGIDTVIGESGYGLSEGQAQRLAIARAILSDTPIWLFDEITSSLDSVTALKLIQRLKELGKDKIFVFVTHDMHLASLCDHTFNLS